ncbi:MAG: UDP-glucuronic acid decarboxylase family protein [Chlamydiota bacterium]
MKKRILILAVLFVNVLTSGYAEEARRVLVAGGAGFLGSHMCDKLIEEGYDVICLDNLQTGSLSNVEHLMGNPNFTFIEHDVIDAIEMQVDEIYNFACPASPPHYQADPIKTLKTSVLGALNLLELAKKCGARIFQASTSEVYGDPIEHPQTESYWGNVNPIGIRSCYDEGKRSAETLFFDYYRVHGVKIKVARIFNTYGPRMNPNDGRVVSNFIVQALDNRSITVYGSGEQTRSFCYVSDLIEGIYLLMHSADEVTGPVNLGNSGEFTLLQLAERVIDLTNSNSILTFEPLPQDDPKQRKPNLSRANSVLNWAPQVDLEEGLKRTIFYFKGNKS